MRRSERHDIRPIRYTNSLFGEEAGLNPLNSQTQINDFVGPEFQAVRICRSCLYVLIFNVEGKGMQLVLSNRSEASHVKKIGLTMLTSYSS